MALETDLEAYYKFDGDLTDSLSNYNLTNNGTESVTGKINQGRDFVASNDDTAYNSSFNKNVYAISLWFKPDSQITSSTSCQRLISFRDDNNPQRWVDLGSSSGYATNETIIINTGTSGNYGRTYIKDNISADWHHLVISWDSGNSEYKFYLDGNEKTIYTGSHSGAADLLNNTNYIGLSDVVQSSDFYNGLIDEVGIWSRALTSSEVTELYNSGDGLQYPFGNSPETNNNFFTLSLGAEF